jgi:hypothetical protein
MKKSKFGRIDSWTYLVECMDGTVERENARIVSSVRDVETTNEG